MTTRVAYEITVADHIAKLEKFVRGSPVGRNFTWFAYFAIVALAWLSAVLFYVKQGDRNYLYIISGAVALILTLTLPMLYRWYQNSFWESVFTPAAVQGLVGRRVLEMHDDFIEEVGGVLSVRARWRDIQCIEEDPLRIWFVFGPLIALVIPSGTFDSAIARDAFVRECRTRIAEKSDGADGANRN